MEAIAEAMESETISGENWRRDTGDRLKRLHSLLFGAELALERGDAVTARTLFLRLIGFLDSQTGVGSDASFVNPIRAEAGISLAKASRLLASESDREAFEQANREDGFVFVKKGIVDIEKIKNSKYFRLFLNNSKINDLSSNNKPCNSEDSNFRHFKQDYRNKIEALKASSNMTQTKLTSIYGDKSLKANTNSFKGLNGNVPSCNSDGYMNIDTETRSIQYGQTGQMGQTGQRNNQNSLPKTPVSVAEIQEDDDMPNGLTGYKPKRVNGFTSPICDRITSPSSNDEAEGPTGGFVTAKAKLAMDNRQKYGARGPPPASPSNEYNNNNNNNINYNNNNSNNNNNNMSMRYNSNNAYNKSNVGFNRRGPRGNFVPPIRNNNNSNNNNNNNMSGPRQYGKNNNNDGLEDSTRKCMEMLCGPDGEIPDKLKNIEPRLIEHISNEIMEKDPNVRWSDIAGLEHAKKCVMEMVIYPLIRPDIFKGCRSPGRGLLLFGPPGTGKTMIGKAIAGEAKATFFYISSSSLTSKWIGEGEKLVRALFGVASCRQPAVIFVDEIDSLLSQRKSEGEHESSRRLKTQFLIEMEGFDNCNDQILLIGATNRPQELDEAARRRLSRRLYIPLPSSEARACIIRTLLEKDGLLKLSPDDILTICKLTEGYSGSDMKNLVKDATMGPLREALIQGTEITELKKEDLRPVNLKDFEDSIQEIRPSVCSSELGSYEEWNKQYGSSKN